MSLVEHPALASHWHAVARSADVAPGPVAVRLLARNYVVWRAADGTLTAAPDRCPHREAPLSIGSMNDAGLECVYHGWTFGAGGTCVAVPSAAEGVPPPPKAHLPVISVEERYGVVWICPGEPVRGIPCVAEEDDDEYRRINTPVEVWHTSAMRMVDNFLDIAHFPFVHTGTFGSTQNRLVPKIELGDLDDEWFGYRYPILADNPQFAQATTRMSDDVVQREMTTGFVLPFTVRGTISYKSGLRHVLLLLSTPIDDVTSLFTFVVWRNDDFSVSAEEVIRFDLAIGAEDKRMLEQLDGVLPLDQTSTVSVQADKASVEWRRRLTEMLDT